MEFESHSGAGESHSGAGEPRPDSPFPLPHLGMHWACRPEPLRAFTDEILAGNGNYLSLELLNWQKCGVKPVDYWVALFVDTRGFVTLHIDERGVPDSLNVFRGRLEVHRLAADRTVLLTTPLSRIPDADGRWCLLPSETITLAGGLMHTFFTDVDDFRNSV